MTLTTGIHGEQSVAVTNENTAKTMGSGTLDVFATPALVALAEKTCWMSVAEALDEGCGTVGTKLELELPASPPVQHPYFPLHNLHPDRKGLVQRGALRPLHTGGRHCAALPRLAGDKGVEPHQPAFCYPPWAVGALPGSAGSRRVPPAGAAAPGGAGIPVWLGAAHLLFK